MKKVILLLALFLTVGITATYAQSKQLNTARTQWNNYIKYDKAEKKTGSLEKAKKAIDETMVKLDELRTEAAGNAKSKAGKKLAKAEAKAWNLRGLIYSEMATLEDSKLSEGAADVAEEAFIKGIEADTKGKYQDQNMSALDQIRVSTYNAGISSFQEKVYATAYEKFMKSMKLGKIIAKKNEDLKIDTAAIAMAAYAAQNAYSDLSEEEKAKEDNKKHLTNAIAHYEQLKGLDYKGEQTYQSLFSLYEQAGDKEKADKILEESKKKFPENASFLIADVNRLLKQEGKKEEALAAMKKAIDVDPKNKSLHFAIGTTYYNEGMIDEAVASYKKAIEIDDKYFDALYNLGLVSYDAASKKITEANNVDINDTEKYDKLMAESAELFNEALPYFTKANEARPKDVQTLIALKEISAKTGKFDKVKEYEAKIEEAKAAQMK